MLEEIRVFVAVVKAGSFSKAADSLATSRSVMSKKVSDLESELGVRLLNRTTRRLSLTEAGEQFFQASSGSLSSLEEAIGEVKSLSGEPRGRLYVNLPMSFGVLHVAPLVGEFLKLYPNIQLDLNFEDRKVGMIDPGFDVSIRIADLQDSSLVAKRLGPCRHAVVAAPSYIKKYGLPQSPEALAVEHVIASNRLQDSALEWKFTDRNTCATSVKVRPEVVVNNSLAIKEIVLSGVALSRMPSFIVGPDIKTGALINLFPEHTTILKTIYAVFPKRAYLPHKTSVFIDFLSEKIGEKPSWDDYLAKK